MRKILNILFITIITTACGFKIVEQTDLGNFYISEIQTNGNNRINYLIKNNLLSTLDNNQKKPLRLILQSEKIKNIKEKNINNEITKYEIIIKIIIKFDEKDLASSDPIVISKVGEFAASEKYSQTINSEKKITELLTDDLSDQIILKISQRLNDL